jgi:hypothetical protein
MPTSAPLFPFSVIELGMEVEEWWGGRMAEKGACFLMKRRERESEEETAASEVVKAKGGMGLCKLEMVWPM